MNKMADKLFGKLFQLLANYLKMSASYLLIVEYV